MGVIPPFFRCNKMQDAHRKSIVHVSQPHLHLLHDRSRPHATPTKVEIIYPARTIASRTCIHHPFHRANQPAARTLLRVQRKLYGPHRMARMRVSALRWKLRPQQLRFPLGTRNTCVPRHLGQCNVYLDTRFRQPLAISSPRSSISDQQEKGSSRSSITPSGENRSLVCNKTH